MGCHISGRSPGCCRDNVSRIACRQFWLNRYWMADEGCVGWIVGRSPNFSRSDSSQIACNRSGCNRLVGRIRRVRWMEYDLLLLSSKLLKWLFLSLCFCILQSWFYVIMNMTIIYWYANVFFICDRYCIILSIASLCLYQNEYYILV